jgi:hypothetical protein
MKYKRGDTVKFSFNGNIGVVEGCRIYSGSNEYLINFKDYNNEWINEDYLELFEYLVDCDSDSSFDDEEITQEIEMDFDNLC